MQVPKRKTSKSRRNMRRSHSAIAVTDTMKCANCGEPKLRHRVCPACGHYRKRAVVAVASAAE